MGKMSRARVNSDWYQYSLDTLRDDTPWGVAVLGVHEDEYFAEEKAAHDEPAFNVLERIMYQLFSNLSDIERLAVSLLTLQGMRVTEAATYVPSYWDEEKKRWIACDHKRIQRAEARAMRKVRKAIIQNPWVASLIESHLQELPSLRAHGEIFSGADLATVFITALNGHATDKGEG